MIVEMQAREGWRPLLFSEPRLRRHEKGEAGPIWQGPGDERCNALILHRFDVARPLFGGGACEGSLLLAVGLWSSFSLSDSLLRVGVTRGRSPGVLRW